MQKIFIHQKGTFVRFDTTNTICSATTHTSSNISGRIYLGTISDITAKSSKSHWSGVGCTLFSINRTGPYCHNCLKLVRNLFAVGAKFLVVDCASVNVTISSVLHCVNATVIVRNNNN